jgi:hypothetical protein
MCSSIPSALPNIRILEEQFSSSNYLSRLEVAYADLRSLLFVEQLARPHVRWTECSRRDIPVKLHTVTFLYGVIRPPPNLKFRRIALMAVKDKVATRSKFS